MTLIKKLGNLDTSSKLSRSSFDDEIQVSKYIPITHFITDEIFCTKNGNLGAIIKITGISFNVKDTEELAHLQYILGFSIQNIGDRIGIYVTTHRHLQAISLINENTSGFIKEFTDSYNKQFSNSELFVNDIYITVIQKSSFNDIKKGLSFLKNLLNKKDNKTFKKYDGDHLKEFKETLENLFSALMVYKPKILGRMNSVSDCREDVAEVLNFLSILVNGCAREYVYPYMEISKFIPEKRLFFGKNIIHFQGLYEGDDRYGAMISVKEYAASTSQGMLNDLLDVPFEYITTHSFLGIEKNKAAKLIETQINRLISSDDKAVSQIEELMIASDDLSSSRINYGFHHNTILILSNDIHTLEANVAKVVKIYQDQRIVVVRETINLEKSFWAQIPGNFRDIRRQAPISSNNFSCFCSLHNYYTGYIDQNHLGSALMMIETPSKTPFYLNLHEKASGRKNDLPKGHTILIGPSNAGKTVMMATMDAMFKKYNIRSIFFDRNLGCEIYVRAIGGKYNRLIPGENTGWNPCQIKDTPKNRKFLRDFISVLSTSKTVALTAKDFSQIAEVVERNFSLPFEKRNLSNIASFFSLSFLGLSALSRYLRLADCTGKSGDRAYLFDNEHDEFELDHKANGFDMTHWLSDSNLASDELLPISMYLFHRIEDKFDGRLTAIYLDEGQQIFQQPYWAAKIDEYIATLRKLNVILFLATQLPDKLAQSSLASGLIQGSATHLFLGNPKARKEDYIDKFKLTEREYEIVKNSSIQSRYFLIKQGDEAAVGRINLQGLEKYISVLSGNQKSVSLCEEIRKEIGDNPSDWLPVFYEKSMST